MLERILQEIKASLKETYLDIANYYSVQDLHHDGDKVACVASAFRDKAVKQIESIIRTHCNDGWTYCSDGNNLPEKDGFYIATLDGGIVGQSEPFSGLAEFENGKWVDDEEDYRCVIAWQPLLPPYRPQKSVGEDYKQQIMDKFLRME